VFFVIIEQAANAADKKVEKTRVLSPEWAFTIIAEKYSPQSKINNRIPARHKRRRLSCSNGARAAANNSENKTMPAAATLLLLRKTNPGIGWLALMAAGALQFQLCEWIVSMVSRDSFDLWTPPQGKIRLWGLHFGAALACFAFYFASYQSPAKHSLGLGFTHPGRLVTYVLVWLGSSLSGGSLPMAKLWGAILVLIFLFLGFLCFRRWRAEDLQIGWLPWLSMGSYALISAALAALGRSHIGMEQALRSRYCTISLWLIIGIIGLSVTLLRQNRERKPESARIGSWLLALLAASFLLFQTRHEVQAADEWANLPNACIFKSNHLDLKKRTPDNCGPLTILRGKWF
jgi:hypothetical protein